MSEALTVELLDVKGGLFLREALVYVRRGNKTLFSRSLQSGSETFPIDMDQGEPVAVIATASRHRQIAFGPIPFKQGTPLKLELVMIPSAPKFRFLPLNEATLSPERAAWWKLLNSDPDAVNRLAALHDGDADEKTKLLLPCLLNVLAAIEGLEKRENLRIVDKLKKIELRAPKKEEEEQGLWRGLQQDRVFVIAEDSLLQELKDAKDKGKLKDARESILLHPHATESFKEEEYGEGNLQFSLVTRSKDKGIPELLRQKVPDGQILVDIDLDIFADPIAHFFLEVIPNTFVTVLGKKKRTDPLEIYASRKTATKFKNARDNNEDRVRPHIFNPPYEILD